MGERRREFYEQGTGRLIQVVEDSRTVEEAQNDQIAELRHTAQKAFESVPTHDQLNAALGLLPMEEADAIKTKITDLREIYAAKKAAIMAAQTVAEVEAVRVEVK